MRRLVLIFLIAVPALAQQPFDKLASDTMTTWRLPGMSVAIVQNDRVVYAKGFGVKEFGKSDPVTADTLFEIGSTTKPLTTTAMAKPIRTTYQYNNIMFMAAGDVVASASKMTWDDFVRARIFQPLGMAQTRSLFADWAATEHATGHRYAHDTIAVQPMSDDTNIGP